MSGRKKYDLVCSLGGNCSVAHNLLFRGLRKFALPFDWTYFDNTDTVYKLADSFAKHFKDQLLKENLEELPINSAHKDKIQYRDIITGIVWANHFKSRELVEYYNVKNKINRRFDRLLNYIEKSNNILFIFAISYAVEIEPFKYLYNKLKELYPTKNINIRILSFSNPEEISIHFENLELCKYTRKPNLYDFTKTNFEWAFLDDIKICNLENSKIITIRKIKKGIKINLIPNISTIFRFKLYFIGIRFDLLIGKERE